MVTLRTKHHQLLKVLEVRKRIFQQKRKQKKKKHYLLVPTTVPTNGRGNSLRLLLSNSKSN